MAKGMNFFDRSTWGTGGFFPDGPGVIVSARFGTFDYGKKGNDQPVMILTAQCKTVNGDNNGEERVQYYGLGQGIDLVNPIKGEKGLYSGIEISPDSEYDKLWANSDFVIFLTALEKAGFDMDSVEGDITALDGLEVEFAKQEKAATKKKKDKDDDDDGDGEDKDKKPRQIVIISDVLDKKKSLKKATKKKDEEEEEEEEAPKNKKVAKKPAKDEDDDADEDNDNDDDEKDDDADEDEDDLDTIIDKYMDLVCVKKNNKTQAMAHKLGIVQHVQKKLGKSADVARSAKAKLNEDWKALLKARGWAIEGGNIVMKDDE